MQENPGNAAADKFIRIMTHPVKSRMFMLFRLPAAFFSGLAIKSLNEEAATVTVPYQWFSKNPFRSTYFACLAMAAEMSTGLLAMMQIYQRKPHVSMLVVKLEATYYKKATGITSFTCNEGAAFRKAVNDCIADNQSRTLTAVSQGVNAQGELVASFSFTWSFKAKS
ncbi:MAG: DUF4442 domain-containing protein, partial [Chitinophagaceae bacterium]